MGKTRLVMEVAQHYVDSTTVSFTDGVFVIELAPLSDGDQIISALAEATGYQFQPDGRDQKTQILDFLSDKSTLLVMDNFEHLLDGRGLVTDLLRSDPQIKIVTTSRQRLGLPGETLFHLAGMDFLEWQSPDEAMDFAVVKYS